MLTLKVIGMTCEHCVGAVTKAVERVPSAEDVLVDLPTGTVTASGHPDEAAVRNAIVEEGYQVAD